MSRKGETALARREQHARLRWIVDENLRFVARTLRKSGVPRSDLDDEIQRTFIVAAGRLADLRAGRERSFLFQVALNVASHARRRIARRREIMDGRSLDGVEAIATPELLLNRKQLRQLLDDVVGSLPESQRVAFTLFERESMSIDEIARLLRVPRGTVASRLRRARAQLRALLAPVEHGVELHTETEKEAAEPPLLRRETVSALETAMLAAGVSARASATAYARTTEALGLIAPALGQTTSWNAPEAWKFITQF